MYIEHEVLQKHFSASIFDIISHAADSMNVECYVIGGYVRDIFLHRQSKDIDVVTVGSGVELAQAIKQQLGRNAYLSVFKNFGTAQIKYHDLEIEFVGARKESYQRDSRKPIVENGTLEDDQNRRDFTINALAVCLNKERFGELLDPFGGLEDMERLIIRTPCDPDITFSDDPLRMMRAIRFSAQLGFDIAPDTFDAITRNCQRIGIISGERIIDELNKIVLSPKPSVGFRQLDTTGILPLIFPELVALKGAETKDGVGHKDNFYHTLAVLDNIALKTDNLWLRWAAILHDIAKPATKRWDPKIGWTFYNHNFIGEKMIPGIFKRMKLPLNDRMKYVQKMVTLHMRPQVLVDEDISDSAVRRLLFEAGNEVEDLMTLCEADITSKNSNKVRRYLQNFGIVRRKFKEIEEKDHIRNFEPPIKGEEIMQIFDLPPCQQVGLLKSAVKDAILDGIIPNSYQEAYEFLIDRANKMGLTPVNKQSNSMCKIAIIVATDLNNAIGKNNELLCHLPNDLRHFKSVTEGHPVIMGRKTYESLPKGALPNRRNIVITHNNSLQYERCEMCESLEQAIELCKNEPIAFIIGGGSIYEATIEIADTIYLTRIHEKFEGTDTFFPILKEAKWREIARLENEADEKNKYQHSFIQLEKIKA